MEGAAARIALGAATVDTDKDGAKGPVEPAAVIDPVIAVVAMIAGRHPGRYPAIRVFVTGIVGIAAGATRAFGFGPVFRFSARRRRRPALRRAAFIEVHTAQPARSGCNGQNGGTGCGAQLLRVRVRRTYRQDRAGSPVEPEKPGRVQPQPAQQRNQTDGRFHNVP